MSDDLWNKALSLVGLGSRRQRYLKLSVEEKAKIDRATVDLQKQVAAQQRKIDELSSMLQESRGPKSHPESLAWGKILRGLGVSIVAGLVLILVDNSYDFKDQSKGNAREISLLEGKLAELRTEATSTASQLARLSAENDRYQYLLDQLVKRVILTERDREILEGLLGRVEKGDIPNNPYLKPTPFDGVPDGE